MHSKRQRQYVNSFHLVDQGDRVGYGHLYFACHHGHGHRTIRQGLGAMEDLDGNGVASIALHGFFQPDEIGAQSAGDWELERQTEPNGLSQTWASKAEHQQDAGNNQRRYASHHPLPMAAPAAGVVG